jgi:hypothetical protein
VTRLFSVESTLTLWVVGVRIESLKMAGGAVAFVTGKSTKSKPRLLCVERYTPKQKHAWDSFVQRGCNSTFLFQRDYMDYHHDRFVDHSMMIYRGDELKAVLPANLRSDGTLASHEGLTYGGLVIASATTLRETLWYFHELLGHLSRSNIPKLLYKRMPAYYSGRPDDELGYCLFLLEARLYRRDCSLVLPSLNGLPAQKRRCRQVKKAVRAGLTIRQDFSFLPFWEQVLTPRLHDRYGVLPVHSAAEIALLATRFPHNIKQFSVYDGAEIVAGITLYETPRVARTQYIAASDKGRKLGALDLLVHWLINQHYHKKPFFDFGGSNEEEGRALNHGLLEWKESFGARACALDFYEIVTADYTRLEHTLPRASDLSSSAAKANFPDFVQVSSL